MAYTFKKRRLYNPGEEAAFKMSRSKIDLFLNCPRCFYLDQRRGVKRPEFPAFTLNSAVDHLLKKEFDIHRAAGVAHPLMKKYKIDAVPLQSEKMDEWRHTFTGIQYLHKPTNFLVYGAIDDLWRNSGGEYHIVDYKATSKDKEPDLEGEYQQSFKRQMEIYQWLFRQNGFKVSPVGYFVYVNGRRDKEAFDSKLEFDVFLISYKGDDSWVEKTLFEIKKSLSGGLPAPAENCEYCGYRLAAAQAAAEEKSSKTQKGATGALF
ncbi:hypothetical protein EPN83_01995 [Patescibacteria group bacterium]|nr:MAG: hypothetical protein EPN83_01995 [Patescibacteria group bacterium]